MNGVAGKTHHSRFMVASLHSEMLRASKKNGSGVPKGVNYWSSHSPPASKSYVLISVYTYIHLLYICIYTHIYIYIYLYSLSLCIYIYMHIRTYDTYTCVIIYFVNRHVYTYIHMYTHLILRSSWWKALSAMLKYRILTNTDSYWFNMNRKWQLSTKTDFFQKDLFR